MASSSPTPTPTPTPTPSSALSSANLSPANEDKAALIRAACEDGRVSTLVELASSSSGLVSDSLRRSAWPLLLGRPHQAETTSPWEHLPSHRDEYQVSLDVHRAFVYYPTNESEKQLSRRKEDLSNVILDVLRRHPTLCYFQGYHDIVQVFLLVLGPQDAAPAVARLSLLRIRDFMLSALSPAMAQLELLRPILRTADPVLYQHLPKSNPSFAIADTITMFAHNIQNYKDITRLFDFFLARHAAMPIYLFAAVVLDRREELLEIEQEDEDILYVTLSKLPQPFHVEFHIARAIELYERLPPAKLNSWEWWKISSSSVLKSSATATSLRSLALEDGEKLLMQQEKELWRRKALQHAASKAKCITTRLWYYRRYGFFSIAILVGAYAFWIGGSRAGPVTRLPSLGPFVRYFRRMVDTLIG